MECDKKLNFVIYFSFVLFIIIISPSAIQSKMCGETDINYPEDFKQLRNCTKVAGSIAISILQVPRNYPNYSDANYHFPELKEITGFLLFHRVTGLKTLEHLFPNLVVIRGVNLMSHYAFGIFEMFDLIEIGLKSLVKIQRGYVSIASSPKLCYANTISWSSMTQKDYSGKWSNLISVNTSAACPTINSCSTCDPQYCWNNKYCQLFDTGYNHNKTIKCHPQCLGGCVNETAAGCNVCQGPNNNGVCVEKCPESKYLHPISLDCVDAHVCRNNSFIPFRGECIKSCPVNYTNYNWMTNKTTKQCFECVKNKTECMKECEAIEITSVAHSDYRRGCQRILGDMIISIQTGMADSMSILERNLGDIEEIKGALIIKRSPVLTSLAFLKNLHTIYGRPPNITSDEEQYSLVLISNDNLQKTWDFQEKKNLKLIHGNLMIQFNSKLCLKEIHALQTMLRTNVTRDRISEESNGYEESCTAITIKSEFEVGSHHNVTIKWERFHVPNNQTIEGYIIYYIIAPDQNITYVGIESCSAYGWQTTFVQNFTDAKATKYTVELTKLKPFTQYAYYVKTQVVSKIHEERVMNIVQGQSEIKYFKTKPNVPSTPEVETVAKTNNSITIRWSSAAEREHIEYYKLILFIQRDDRAFLDTRNYCHNPRKDVHVSIGTEVKHPNDTHTNCTIDCSRRNDHERSDDIRLEILKFIENRFSNGCPWGDKECISDAGSNNVYRLERATNQDLLNNDDAVVGQSQRVQLVIVNATETNTTVGELLPYTLYTMHFFACNNISCSEYFMHSERTESSIYADRVNFDLSLDSTVANTVHLDFTEPETPNGLTVAFHIDKHDLANFSQSTTCITRKQHYSSGKRFSFTNLNRGQYSFRIRSISLALNGDYTEYKYINVTSVVSVKSSIFIVLTTLVIALSMTFIVYHHIIKWRGRRQVGDLNTSRQNLIENDAIAGSFRFADMRNEDDNDEEHFGIAEEAL